MHVDQLMPGVQRVMPTSEILRPDGDIYNTLLLFPDTGEDPYEDVDEVVSDEDSTYLYWESGTATRKSGYFTAADPSATPGSVVSVEVHCVAKRTPAGVGSELCLLWAGTVAGTRSSKSMAVLKDGNYTEYSEIWTTSPVTSLAWTWAEINDLLIGVSLRAVGAGNKTFATQLWAVVNRS